MSLFDSASLVVTPNGYKEDKLYSIKPTDGSGDLVVTRATTATRVNSDGLIEQVPYNLLERSEQFDNAYWGKANMVIVANDTIAPNGTATADKATSSLYPSTSIFKSQLVSAINHTLSCYVKADSLSSFRMEFVSSGYAAGTTCIYNLTTQATTITNYGSTTGSTATITSIGNGWFRCTLTVLSTATTYFTQLFPAGNGSLFLWGAQLVTGTSAKEYFPTTDRLDIPRLDYTNSTCPSILVEPQRTNLVTYSEQFDNGAWYKDNVSISANSLTSPSGIQNADSILETATTATHTTYNRASMTSGQAYTQSCYFKANGRNRVIMQIFDNATQYANAIFDLSSGVVVASFGTATIQNMTNGWYRCTITGTSPATGLGYCVIGLCENTYSTPSVFPTYLGDITKGVYAWGFQVEQGSYATSYIPTVASSVTRNADVISKTGISSLIGQTEGTFFLDLYASAKNKDGGSFATWFIAGDVTNNFQIYNLGSNLYWFARNTAGGIFLDQLANQTIVEGTRYKIAIAYKSGDYALYINGIQKRTNTNTNIPTVSQFNLSTEGFGSSPAIVKNEYNSVQFYKTRLTNSELASLTTI